MSSIGLNNLVHTVESRVGDIHLALALVVALVVALALQHSSLADIEGHNLGHTAPHKLELWVQAVAVELVGVEIGSS